MRLNRIPLQFSYKGNFYNDINPIFCQVLCQIMLNTAEFSVEIAKRRENYRKLRNIRSFEQKKTRIDNSVLHIQSIYLFCLLFLVLGKIDRDETNMYYPCVLLVIFSVYFYDSIFIIIDFQEYGQCFLCSVPIFLIANVWMCPPIFDVLKWYGKAR